MLLSFTSKKEIILTLYQQFLPVRILSNHNPFPQSVYTANACGTLPTDTDTDTDTDYVIAFHCKKTIILTRYQQLMPVRVMPHHLSFPKYVCALFLHIQIQIQIQIQILPLPLAV